MSDDPSSDHDHPFGDLDQLINVALKHFDDCIGSLHDDCRASRIGAEALATLQFARASPATLAAAIGLCRSADETCRRFGAAILGQLGHCPDNPYGVFQAQRYGALEELLRTEMATVADPGVLNSACTALGHLGDRRAVPLALELIGHADEDVRFGVVMVLTGHDDEAAIAGLIRLASDPGDDVRDWATFGLGQQIDVDTAAIRAALHARLGDG